MMRGFEISSATIDLDVIRKVGHGGHYLGQRQTRDLFRREHWRSRWMDKNSIDGWQNAGGRRYAEVLAEKAARIIASHRPAPLTADMTAALQTLYDRAASDRPPA
jgi:trimethylamine--corrinoid protein Co-methyltransferase